MRYAFRTLDQGEAQQLPQYDFSNLRGINPLTGPEWGDENILTYGRLLTLFGEPLYSSQDVESQYTYFVEATDQMGTPLYLMVYAGPSGPAIGGPHTPAHREAADQLADAIRAAVPTDYDYVGCYFDTASKVEQGVKSGIPYGKETHLPDAAFLEAFKKVYGA